jgi:uncharacterized radical SAM superfamily Fe-S cluster-containing enzyme
MHIAWTSALCPSCKAVLRAALVERAGDVYLDLDCPAHGRAQNLYFRDAALYRTLSAARSEAHCCDEYSCAKGEPCAERRGSSLIFMVNVTNRCNMTCGACFSNSSAALEEPLAPVEDLLANLPDASTLDHPSPHAVLIGGEPTLHPELPRLVELLLRRGFVPRLATNGLRLRSAEYARRLADAGLEWVFIHFDSADDGLNERMRGRPMLEATLEAVARCRDTGMKVQFGTTLTAENLGEASELLHLAHRSGVFWVSFYPLAEIERTGDARPIYLADVIDALELQTRGDVGRADFVAATRIWSAAYRATKRLNFRQKPTMVSLPLVVDGGRLVPVTRFANPLEALRRPHAAAALLRSLPNLLDYERRGASGSTLVVNIQQFQGRSAFDLAEATHSHMSFAHAGSFLPFDVYNHVHRYAAERLVPAERIVRTV